LIIDPDPYVLPLEAILEENERVLAVKVSKKRSELFVYHLGYFRQVERIKSFVPKVSVDASIPGRVQRHRLAHLEWHLKATANASSRQFGQWSCRGLILMAENRVSHLLEEFLHESLREKIMGRVYGSPTTSDRDPRTEIEGILRSYREHLEERVIQELSEYHPEIVASGLSRVLSVATAVTLGRCRPISVCAEELTLSCCFACDRSLVFFPQRPTLFPTEWRGLVRRPPYGNFRQIPVSAEELHVSLTSALKVAVECFEGSPALLFLKLV
jgi:hypothetical protein